MARQTRFTGDLPADVGTVFAAVTGPVWAARRAERLHDDSRLVSRTATPGGGVEVAVSRRLPEGVPGFLKRFLPADGRVLQTDSWEPPAGGILTGRWALSAAGVPARIGGALRLEPAGSGCRQVVSGEVAVAVPLVGGRAESYLAGMLEELLTREGALLAELVAVTG